VSAAAVPGVAWPRVGPTAAEVVHREGSARLLRYRPAPEAAPAAARPPVLIVLPVINRYYILDLTERTSVVSALVARGIDTFLLDWGRPLLADRERLGLDGCVERILPRFEAKARAAAGAGRIVLGGYCLGGTIAACRAALAGPESGLAGLVTINAPVSFADAGFLGRLTEPDCFPLGALLGAFGNMPGALVQEGFTGLKPTQQVTKYERLFERAADADFAEEFAALELWNRDNVPIAGSFYRTLIEDLYRGDRLARGELEVGGRRVDLGAIGVPTLVISTEDDAICLPAQATALLEKIAPAAEREHVSLRGGHIRGIVGKGSRERVATAIEGFLGRRCKG
jgi:polyhydroxyalkanoate synthase